MTQIAALKVISNAAAAIERVKTLEEVTVLRNETAKLHALTQVLKHGTKLHADCDSMMLLAKRKAGELTSKIVQAPAGRKKSVRPQTDSAEPKPKHEVLRELQLPRRWVAEAEKLHALPEAVFNERLAHRAEQVAAGKPPPNLLTLTSDPNHKPDEWGTPGKYLESAREVLGDIELDIASNDAAQELVRATRYFTKDRSALDPAASWACRTAWFQPPFSSQLIAALSERLVREWCSGVMGALCGLTNLDPSTKWWRDLAGISAGHVLADHRIAFLRAGVPYKGNEFTQWFFYCGADVERFFDVFSEHGMPFRSAQHAPEATA